MADLVLWFVQKGEVLGLHGGDVGHEHLRYLLRHAMSWGRMALLSSLAGDYLVHLGIENASESDKLTRSMTVTGTLVWMLFVLQQTNWAVWPLVRAGRLNLESALLLHGCTLIYAITLIQVTALVISAARQSTVALAEMDREDRRTTCCVLSPTFIKTRLPRSGGATIYRIRKGDGDHVQLIAELDDSSSPAGLRRMSRVPHSRGAVAQGSGQREMDVLFPDRFLLEGRPEVSHEVFDTFLNDVLGRACTGRDQERVDPREPFVPDLADAIDQVRRDAKCVGDFREPAAVRAVLTAEHEHEIGTGGQVANGFLPVLRRVADIVFRGIGDSREFFPEGGDHDVRIVDAQGRLGKVGNFSGIWYFEAFDVFGCFDEDHLVGRLAHCADDFVVPFVADQDDGVAFSSVADGFEMHFDDERAGGVDGKQAAFLSLVANLGGDTVSAVEERRAGWNFVDRLDENGAALSEAIDDELVMHDFMIDVEGRTEEVERPLEALDRHIDARAEASRIGQHDLHQHVVSRIEKKSRPSWYAFWRASGR